MDTPTTDFVRAGSLEELKAKGRLVMVTARMAGGSGRRAFAGLTPSPAPLAS